MRASSSLSQQEVARFTDRLGEKLDEALELVLEEFLDRHEPVRKAERAQKRERNFVRTEGLPTEPNSNSVQTRTTASSAPKQRKPLPAHTKHEVIARDQARCTFIDAAGHRCTSDRWLQLHHVVPVSRGGEDEPANLKTLCPFHHDLVHQLGFPLEGQVNWIREPVRAYRQ